MRRSIVKSSEKIDSYKTSIRVSESGTFEDVEPEPQVSQEKGGALVSERTGSLRGGSLTREGWVGQTHPLGS